MTRPLSEFDIEEDKGLGPAATALGHPLGSWVVKEVRLLVCYDPENGDTAPADQIADLIEKDLIGRGVGMVHVKEEDEVGYVMGSWHGPHGYGVCDCGPEFPDDWHERINPLLPEGLIALLDRARSHAEVHEHQSEADSLEIGIRDAERALNSVSINRDEQARADAQKEG